MRGRVVHVDTDAPGIVLAQVGAPDYAGDLSGPWSLVQFDDGLRCWCPDVALCPEQIPAETAGRVAENMVQ